MATCGKRCNGGGRISHVLERYEDDLIGAPFKVVIEGAVEETSCAVCGEVISVTLPNMAGLISAIAMARAAFPAKLNGPEIRFLRKAAGWKGVKCAENLRTDPATLSRWENGHQTITEMHEKLLRALVCLELLPHAPLQDFCPSQIAQLRICPARDAREHLVATCRQVSASKSWKIDQGSDQGRPMLRAS